MEVQPTCNKQRTQKTTMASIFTRIFVQILRSHKTAFLRTPSFFGHLGLGQTFFSTQHGCFNEQVLVSFEQFGYPSCCAPQLRNSDYVGISKTLYGGDAIFLMLALSLMFLLSVFLSCVEFRFGVVTSLVLVGDFQAVFTV